MCKIVFYNEIRIKYVRMKKEKKSHLKLLSQLTNDKKL